MGWSDFTSGTRNILIFLWFWQCLDITLHALANLVTVPHTCANCVWWISIPVILFNMKPPEARKAIVAANVMYLCFIFTFIIVYISSLNAKDATVFWVLVFVSQTLTAGGAYLAGFKPEYI